MTIVGFDAVGPAIAAYIRASGGVTVLENGAKGGVIAGQPHVLASICLRLGFKNPCKNGRVFLTAPKMSAIGFGDAVGTVPNWRSLSTEALRAISMGGAS